jgi:hypothetical protein
MIVKLATALLLSSLLTMLAACSDSSDSQTARTPLPDHFVLNSDVFYFVLNQPPDTPFEIFRVDLGAFDRE